MRVQGGQHDFLDQDLEYFLVLGLVYTDLGIRISVDLFQIVLKGFLSLCVSLGLKDTSLLRANLIYTYL